MAQRRAAAEITALMAKDGVMLRTDLNGCSHNHQRRSSLRAPTGHAGDNGNGLDVFYTAMACYNASITESYFRIAPEAREYNV
jgi:hypothetical protein